MPYYGASTQDGVVVSPACPTTLVTPVSIQFCSSLAVSVTDVGVTPLQVHPYSLPAGPFDVRSSPCNFQSLHRWLAFVSRQLLSTCHYCDALQHYNRCTAGEYTMPRLYCRNHHTLTAAAGAAGLQSGQHGDARDRALVRPVAHLPGRLQRAQRWRGRHRRGGAATIWCATISCLCAST